MEVGLRYVDELGYHELGSLGTGENSRIVVRLLLDSGRRMKFTQ